MKLKIAAFILWAGCISALLTLEMESFQRGFFSLMLTIAMLMIFALRVFLEGDQDN